jgi:hypothetical protein
MHASRKSILSFDVVRYAQRSVVGVARLLSTTAAAIRCRVGSGQTRSKKRSSRPQSNDPFSRAGCFAVTIGPSFAHPYHLVAAPSLNSSERAAWLKRARCQALQSVPGLDP